METNTLQKSLLRKVKAMTPEQLFWLDNILKGIPPAENESDRELIQEMMVLQDHGGSFDFLNDEPETYSVADCPFIYDAASDRLIRNGSFISAK